MPLRSTLSALLSLTLAASTVAVPATTHAQSPAFLVLGAMADSATILGLDGKDAAAAGALTDSLRRAFAKRGLGGGEELSLAEVRLTMGCSNDEPPCLAEAGKSLGVRKLVYGYLKPDKGGYRLELAILDVDQGIVDAETTTPLAAADLQPDQIDATALDIVNSLFPEEHDSEAAGPADISSGAQPEVEPAPAPPEPRKSKYEWGNYSPRPKWKWVGFGVSIGLLVVGGATVLGSGIALKTSLHNQLLDKADASLKDSNPANDIDASNIPPGYNNDICNYAREVTGTAPNGGPAVRNAAVTRICNKSDGVHKLNLAGVGVTVAGAVGTILFTTLLFVHRRGPSAAALLRHHFTIGASPATRGRGVLVGSQFRF